MAATAERPAAARIRIYRQGLGDCFLVTLPRQDGEANAFHIMIDCGVLLGTPDAPALMTRVVEDIHRQTGGTVDLLVVTHEHWDHVSGFLQAAEALQRITFRAVWMGWTESGDPQAKRLEAGRARALAALSLAQSHMRLFGAAELEELSGLLEFFGAGGGRSTRDAMAAARRLAPPGGPRYAEPGEKPTALPGTGARLYVLGPPRDEALLLRSDPSRRAPETYGFGVAGFPLGEVEECLGAAAPDGPFGPRFSIPMEVARGLPDFRAYWSDGPVGAGEGEAWRRIDSAWLDGATDLALRLDHDTNNTSLALAIELANGEVLLFAADAQVGSWLSWQDLRWEVEGRAVTGPDLLARTVFYKVGHHGSHNATLRDKGLELMTRLRVAAVTVDEAIAQQRRWGRIPFPGLLDRLEEQTGGRVLRTDRAPPAAIAGLAEDALWFELDLAAG
jgi:hypothetical protein